jgi:hypothetical protein
MVCGDNPMQSFIGGFKESVTAEKPCRQRLATKPGYLKITELSQFQMGTKEGHERHVLEVESHTPVPQNQQLRRLPGEEHHDPAIRYGINYRSPLMSVPYFDIATCLVQDLMRVGPEGIEELLCRMVLSQVINVDKKLKLCDVNQ